MDTRRHPPSGCARVAGPSRMVTSETNAQRTRQPDERREVAPTEISMGKTAERDGDGFGELCTCAVGWVESTRRGQVGLQVSLARSRASPLGEYIVTKSLYLQTMPNNSFIQAVHPRKHDDSRLSPSPADATPTFLMNLVSGVPPNAVRSLIRVAARNNPSRMVKSRFAHVCERQPW